MSNEEGKRNYFLTLKIKDSRVEEFEELVRISGTAKVHKRKIEVTPSASFDFKNKVTKISFTLKFGNTKNIFNFGELYNKLIKN